MTLEINEPSRYASAAATRALSLAVRAAPVMMDSRTPTTGLMRSVMPVGFQKSASCVEQRFHAARSYSLIRPPRTGRRVMRSWLRSATGWVGRGGRRSRAR
jgi:hypothetical protein